jgi:hypothetical protein
LVKGIAFNRDKTVGIKSGGKVSSKINRLKCFAKEFLLNRLHEFGKEDLKT